MQVAEPHFIKDIDECLRVLRNGGIILYPTDTVWGLGCDATNETAANRIIELKQRPANKSFVVLVSGETDILTYTAAPDLAVFDYLQTVEKPTTVIYEHALGLASNVLAADGSVAIRICKDEFCSYLLKRFKKPIVSTSANISGEPFPTGFTDISPVIKKGVDYVVQHRSNEPGAAIPSSVIRWNNGEIDIIRP